MLAMHKVNQFLTLNLLNIGTIVTVNRRKRN
jgi:hypothetical protein